MQGHSRNCDDVQGSNITRTKSIFVLLQPQKPPLFLPGKRFDNNLGNIRIPPNHLFCLPTITWKVTGRTKVVQNECFRAKSGNCFPSRLEFSWKRLLKQQMPILKRMSGNGLF